MARLSAMSTVQNALKAMGTSSENLQGNLNLFLQHYRKAPHAETGDSPAKLFLGRNIRTRLDLVRPQDTSTKISEKQRATFESSFRTFTPGEQVYFLSGNARMDKWIPGTIFSRLGDLHYEIVFKGKHLKRHIDQMRCFHNGNELSRTPSSETREASNSSGETTRHTHFYGNILTSLPTPTNSESSAASEGSRERSSAATDSFDERFLTPSSSPDRRREISPPAVRRTTRLRRAPLKYSP